MSPSSKLTHLPTQDIEALLWNFYSACKHFYILTSFFQKSKGDMKMNKTRD